VILKDQVQAGRNSAAKMQLGLRISHIFGSNVGSRKEIRSVGSCTIHQLIDFVSN